MASPDDIVLWPDGNWLYRHEFELRHPRVGGNYTYLAEGSVDHQKFLRAMNELEDSPKPVDEEPEIDYDYCAFIDRP